MENLWVLWNFLARRAAHTLLFYWIIWNCFDLHSDMSNPCVKAGIHVCKTRIPVCKTRIHVCKTKSSPILCVKPRIHVSFLESVCAKHESMCAKHESMYAKPESMCPKSYTGVHVGYKHKHTAENQLVDLMFLLLFLQHTYNSAVIFEYEQIITSSIWAIPSWVAVQNICIQRKNVKEFICEISFFCSHSFYRQKTILGSKWAELKYDY